VCGNLDAVGSGDSSSVRSDVHAARIGGVAGVGRSPAERQQGIECLDFGPSDPTDNVGQVGFRVDPVQAAGFHQAVNHGGDLAGGIRADHVPVLAPDSYPRSARSAVRLSISRVPSAA
jgi:hypothetical protein